MMKDFQSTTVSVVVLLPGEPSSEAQGVEACVHSALAQDLPPLEVLIVDGRSDAAGLPLPEDLTGDARIVHLPGTYRNRAAMINAAIERARGAYLLLLAGDPATLHLRRSALLTLVMAATRAAPATDRPIGMVYADFERVDADGGRSEVHLLDWHEGRLRDAFDTGPVLLFPTAVLQETGGPDELFQAADLYDLRLRATARHRAVHVANRFAGSLYTVAASARTHDVFDYLLATKDTQLEMERACTAHLKRIGAYLAPDDPFHEVTYTDEEAKPFSQCIASVVIPVHQRPGFIGRAIESVQAQTVPGIEVIVVVNGGEADPTAAAVRRYLPGGDHHQPDAPPVRLLVVDVNNLGLCLNAGIAAARGKYYVQLDSDDQLMPDAVEKILGVFEADRTVGMVIGSYEVWTLDDATGELRRNDEIPVVTHDEWTADNGRNNLLRINGAGAPRSAHIKVIREVGWFGVNDSPSCRNYGEDYDLVLRISERYRIGRVWDPIYRVIRHAGGTDHAVDQVTIDRNDNAKDEMRREALHRRRALNRSDAAPSRG
jgi:glycosyltransferase involved in cell wall biosynthesis